MARSVFCDRSERLNLLINEDDHLRIQATRGGFDLEAAWRSAQEIDAKVSSRLTYAWHPQFGYVTSSPTNVGTGFRVSTMLHLPGLRITRQMDRVVRTLEKIKAPVHGLWGRGSQATGDCYQITNGVSLGRNEEELLDNITNIVPVIIEYERQARDFLLRESQAALHDRVSRAYGLLRTAAVISSEETMHLLSQVRLGVALGLIEDVDVSKLNELFLLTQPGHLQILNGVEMTAQHRNAARGTLLQKELSPT